MIDWQDRGFFGAGVTFVNASFVTPFAANDCPRKTRHRPGMMGVC